MGMVEPIPGILQECEHRLDLFLGAPREIVEIFAGCEISNMTERLLLIYVLLHT